MRKEAHRNILLIVMLALLALVLLVLSAGFVHRQQLRKQATTQSFVDSLTNYARRFEGKNLRWPQNISELVSFAGIPAMTNDPWGHSYGLQPFDPELGYGQVFSFGRDGLLGGTGSDSDIVATFRK